MWPRVAVFEAAKELWKLKNAPDVEKVCSSNAVPASYLTYVFRRGKHAHHAEGNPLT